MRRKIMQLPSVWPDTADPSAAIFLGRRVADIENLLLTVVLLSVSGFAMVICNA